MWLDFENDLIMVDCLRQNGIHNTHSLTAPLSLLAKFSTEDLGRVKRLGLAGSKFIVLVALKLLPGVPSQQRGCDWCVHLGIDCLKELWVDGDTKEKDNMRVYDKAERIEKLIHSKMVSDKQNLEDAGTLKLPAVRVLRGEQWCKYF